MQFSNLKLSDPILRAVATQGYTQMTPIQSQAIPPILMGRDLLGCAQTGTGKTAAFALPILQRLSNSPRTNGQGHQARCLVLCPTRELASQIAQGFSDYGRNLQFRHMTIFGGVGENPQIAALRQGRDIIIATPGRLLDLMNQGQVDLRGIEVLVLDEADRMLDMGFIRDIRKIVSRLPVKRQTLLFSATMPREIRELAETFMHNPVTVQVAPPSTTAANIDESIYFVEKHNKPQLLAHLVENLPMSRAIVFTRTKHGADKVVRHLHTAGIRAEAIHGNKSQNARTRAMDNFRKNKIPVLVATDIASRGIDIDAITHVVNFDLSHEPETYVHRIGRTARAGATGRAPSFCDHEEKPNLRAIERLIKRPIPVCNDHPAYAPRESNHHGQAQNHSQSARHQERPANSDRRRSDGRQPQAASASGNSLLQWQGHQREKEAAYARPRPRRFNPRQGPPGRGVRHKHASSRHA